MTTTHETRRASSGGYTLVEMVTVIVIMSTIGMVSSYVVLQSMKAYARTTPMLDATYKVRMAAERMRRELRDLRSTDSVAVMTATALSFEDSSSTLIAYALDGTDLERNGDALASGVTALAFQYWKADGTAATAAADLHFLEVDLTVQSADQLRRMQIAAFPRVLTPIDLAGPGATSSAGSLIAHWAMDESSGTTAAESIAANDATLHNGATFGASGPTSGATAVSFDGIDDYIEVPHSSAYLLDRGTVQFWFNANDTYGTQGLFSKDSSGYDTGGHLHCDLYGDDLYLRLQSTSQSHWLYKSNAITPGVWHHVAFSFGEGGVKLYLDGVLVDTDPYTGGLGTTSGGVGNYEPLSIGASSWKSGNLVITPLESYFMGRIDEVAIFDVELSAAEIGSLYSAGGTID